VDAGWNKYRKLKLHCWRVRLEFSEPWDLTKIQNEPLLIQTSRNNTASAALTIIMGIINGGFACCNH
jgi:hypothetical protein